MLLLNLIDMQIFEAQYTYNLIAERQTPVLDTPGKLVDYTRKKEEGNLSGTNFWVFCLNRKNKLLGFHRICSNPELCKALLPLEVFCFPIIDSAAAIVLVKNLPGVAQSPSAEDIDTAKRLKEAATSLDIDFHDYVVFGVDAENPDNAGYYSLEECGLP